MSEAVDRLLEEHRAQTQAFEKNVRIIGGALKVVLDAKFREMGYVPIEQLRLAKIEGAMAGIKFMAICILVMAAFALLVWAA